MSQLLALLLLLGAEDPTSRAAVKPITVPFELMASKHMAIQIKVNGKGPYRVIFDTGAPISLISTKIAKETGLMPKNAPKPVWGLMMAGEAKIKTFEVGNLKTNDVQAIIMDHPTVELAATFLGPLEGIIGFPFFARYRMTLDYQAKQLTFVPNGYQPQDALQSVMASVFGGNPDGTRGKRVVAAQAIWGLVPAKAADDEQPGVTLEDILPGSAADVAGLKSGDRLLTLDGRWTDSVADCHAAAATVKPGVAVSVRLTRAGRPLTLEVRPRTGL